MRFASSNTNNLTIGALLMRCAELYRDNTAIFAPNRHPLTYGQLRQFIEQQTALLRSAGIQRNDRIAIVLPNGPEMALSFLTIATVATCAPLNPAYRATEFQFYLDDLKPKAVLTLANWPSSVRDVCNELQIPIIELVPQVNNSAGWFDLIFPSTLPLIDMEQIEFADSSDIALVLHTSGTTSRPKIVPLSQSNLCVSANNISTALALTPSDCCLNIMPLFHIHGLMAAVLASMNAGASVFCTPGFVATEFYDWLDESQATWYTAVPTMHQSILARAEANRESIARAHLRLIRSSSAALPTPVLANLEATFGVPVIEAYGMTEASHQMASNPLPPRPRKPGSVGLAAGPEIAIMDQDGNLLPAHQLGEIVICGNNVTQGYENNPSANQSAFTNGWFRTGDQGYLDENNYLFLTGRLKELINRAGEKISPLEVDDVLLRHPAVAQAVTFSVPHPQLGEEVAAAVVLRDMAQTTELDLRQFSAQYLADFKVPRMICFLDEIPKGPTGKLQRIGLAERLGITFNETAPRAEYADANTNTEAALIDIWKAVLRIDRIGIHDNFFQLGGDSILAAQTVARVGNHFGVSLPIVSFFTLQTVAQIAAYLDNARQNADEEGHLPAENLTEPLAIIPDPSRMNFPFPLTDIQQAYWVGRSGEFMLGNVATHLYFEVDAFQFDPMKFEAALNQMIRRHGMMRAIIIPNGTQQILQQALHYKPVLLDLRSATESQKNAAFEQIRQELSHQVLPTDRWPIFEIRITRIADDHYRLHFSFDALIMDGWSRRLMFYELGQLYAGNQPTPSELTLSFRDYVLVERAMVDAPQTQRSRAYWLSRIDSLPSAPELPLAENIVSEITDSTSHFTTRQFMLNSTRWQKLKDHAKEIGLTPSSLLLTVYSEILRLWSKQPRFTLNLTFFNRQLLHEDVNNILGDFTSLSLLEVNTALDIPFKERALHLQRQLWQDLDHRHWSGIQVLRELSKRSGNPTQALIPVVFTSLFTNDPRFKETPHAWLGEEVYRVSQTPQVWIDLQVAEESGELICYWNAVESLFSDNLSMLMFTRFGDFLNWLAEDTESWESTWPAVVEKLLPPEQHELYQQVNATEKPIPDGLLHDNVLHQIATAPDNIAVITPQRTMTYGELGLLSTRIGQWLRDHRAEPNTLVGVVMERGWEQVVGVLAILQSGAAYLPIDADLPEARLLHLIQHGEVKLILTQSWLDLNLPSEVTVLYVDTADQTLPALPLEFQSISLAPAQSPDDLAYVIYTSGSTGLPKGVMISHRSALNTIVDLTVRFQINQQDRVLAISALTFDLSVYDLFGILGAGGTVVMPDPQVVRDPAHWAELVATHRITLWNSAPALVKLLVDYTSKQNRSPLESLRLVWMSGDWIPVTLPDQLRTVAPHATIISMGGATEASIWSILYPIEHVDPAWKSIPYGKPLDNQRFYVLDEALEPRPVGVTGNLYIGGIGVAQGYWRDEEKTRARFIRHPRTNEYIYWTGDLGRYLPDGNIEFLGREDDQVKIQGFRIELGEITYALLKHSSIQDAAVTAAGEKQGTRRLVAYLVERAPVSDQDIRDYLKAKLPAYMIPALFVRLSVLPLSSNGKVNLKALPDPTTLNNNSNSSLYNLDEHNQLIDRISASIKHVLNVATLEPQANLLELGVTSLDMVLIVNHLDQSLGFRHKIDDLYQTPTVEGIAAAYERKIARQNVAVAVTPNTSGQRLSTWGTVPAYPLIDDPKAREAFKNEQPGVRHDLSDSTANAIQLPIPDLTDELKHLYLERRSQRTFSSQPIRAAQLGSLLSNLRQITVDGHIKYRYGSAGGLYPVQTYIYIKPNAVEALAGGIYYYHPVTHRLIQLNTETIDAGIYGPLVNRPIFNQAAFAIFLVGAMKAIAPLYQEQSLRYALLEAGTITQLLEMSAVENGIGLCQIGSLDFNRISGLFQLEEGHVLLHSLLGGGLPGGATQHQFAISRQQSKRSSILVSLKTTGSRPPLFCIHGQFGGVFFYQKFIPYLRDDQPVYGIQAPGMDGEEIPLNSIDDMADRYVKTIQLVQPSGPYYLCGYSLGGRIALEIGRRLMAAGQQVNYIGMIDDQLSVNAQSLSAHRRPTGFGTRLLKAVRTAVLALRILPVRYKFIYFRERLTDIHTILRQPDDIPEGGADLPPSVHKVWKACYMAAQSYIPTPYDGSITYFRATGKPINAELMRVLFSIARGPLELIEVPGDHLSLIREPNVEIVSQKLAESIDRAIRKIT